ncbi:MULTISPECIES: hypothetical protein [Gordonibacter]|uniref:Zinc-ribbon domain-containing protein n=1 Tax=Gordonibacter faecis TaxID=3047475 RepID=A0ABT7DMY4_9ACTN|nr:MULTISPECIES: hypothetical protein [unclassified Gordonibacter]MDJ1650899.1 hypothetical protein [Gordonibacter sp. KGMB12511]HIW77440.1 hypothetical protein [Candidatus Gordonibacter avicola]
MCFRPSAVDATAPTSKTCARCGATNDAAAAVCASCGSDTFEEAPLSAPGVPEAPAAPGVPGAPAAPTPAAAPAAPAVSAYGEPPHCGSAGKISTPKVAPRF